MPEQRRRRRESKNFCRLLFAAGALALIGPCWAPAQDGSARRVVRHPEQIAGLWETSDGDRVLGLEIELTTEIQGAPTTLRGVDQVFDVAMIQVYESARSPRNVVGARGFMSDSPGVDWRGDRLRIEPGSTPPEIGVDLRLDATRGVWTGRLRRGKTERQVVLRRPKAGPDVRRNALVGTWQREGR